MSAACSSGGFRSGRALACSRADGLCRLRDPTGLAPQGRAIRGSGRSRLLRRPSRKCLNSGRPQDRSRPQPRSGRSAATRLDGSEDGPILDRVMARVAPEGCTDPDHASCLAFDTAWATGRATPVGDPWPARMARRSWFAANDGVALPVAQVPAPVHRRVGPCRFSPNFWRCGAFQGPPA